MFERLGMMQRGALIIGVPCLLQLSFGLMLLSYMTQAEHIAAKTSQLQHETFLALRMNYLGPQVATTAIMYQMTGSQVHLRSYELGVSYFRAVIHALDKEPMSPRSRRHYAEIPPTALRFLQSTEMLIRQPPRDYRNFLQDKDNLEFIASLRPLSKQLVLDLCRLISDDKRQVDALSTELDKMHTIIIILLVVNCVSGLAVAGAISAMLHQAFVTRLSVLVDNTARITKGQELNPPLSGRDELVFLDKAIHSMYQGLQSAETFRREIVSIITHDLRAPLTSLALFLEHISGNYVQLTAKGETLVQTMLPGVYLLTRRIDELLDAEKLRAGKLALVRSTTNLLGLISPLAERHANITLVIPAELYVSVDRLRLEQSIEILLPAGDDTSASDLITLSAAKTSGGTTIVIHESGAAEQVRPGRGLELSIARALIEAHDGSLQAAITDGGLQIEIFLPELVAQQALPVSEQLKTTTSQVSEPGQRAH